MPIDSSIYSQSQQSSPLNALASGYQLGNTIRQQPMQDKLNQQKLDAGQLSIDAQKMKMQQMANDSRVKSTVIGASELQNAPIEQWGNILQDRINGASRYGYDAEAEKSALNMLQSNPEELKKHVDGLVNFGKQVGIIGGANSDLRQQEIDLRREALRQSAQQFGVNAGLQQKKIDQESRMMDIQDKRLSAAIDPTLQGDLSSAKSTGAATGKKGAERQAQWEDWTAFQGALSHVYPDIGGIMQSAPGSSISQAVNTYGSKLVGGTDAYVAGKKLNQLAAILMQQVPFPPGAQSEKEMEQRNKTLGAIEDPNISPADKLDMINKFLSMNEYKFKALAPKDGQQLPNGNVPPPAGMPATPENMNPNNRPPLSSFEGK